MLTTLRELDSMLDSGKLECFEFAYETMNGVMPYTVTKNMLDFSRAGEGILILREKEDGKTLVANILVNRIVVISYTEV